MTVEILYLNGCPHDAALAPRIREIATAAGIEVDVRHKLVRDDEAGARERFSAHRRCDSTARMSSAGPASATTSG